MFVPVNDERKYASTCSSRATKQNNSVSVAWSSSGIIGHHELSDTISLRPEALFYLKVFNIEKSTLKVL